MRWYVELSGKPKGPIEELELIKAIQAGSVTRGSRVCEEGTEDWVPIEAHPQFAVLFGGAVDGTKLCPYCAEPILAAAVKCKHCQSDLRGSVGDARAPNVSSSSRAPSEALGILMLLLPVLSTFLVWFWVGNMNFLQNPGQTLLLIMGVTVGGTAVLGASEAQSVGAGGANDTETNGSRRSGPVAWFFGICLLWLFLYPAWMYQRSKYGLKSMFVGGVVVPICFVVSNVYMIGALQAKAQEARQSAADLYRRLHEETVLTETPPVVTYAKFEQLSPGMTYEQVVSVIGEQGRLGTSSKTPGYNLEMYSWSNSGGSSLSAMFENGKLTNKSQFGLR